jgi:hypothetical protein
VAVVGNVVRVVDLGEQGDVRLRLRRRAGGGATLAGAIGDKAEARNIADAITAVLGR